MRSHANGGAFFIYIIICRVCKFRGSNGELSGRWKVSLSLERTTHINANYLPDKSKFTLPLKRAHGVLPYGVCADSKPALERLRSMALVLSSSSISEGSCAADKFGFSELLGKDSLTM